MKRLFKTENEVGENSFMFFDEKEIEKEYNVYGFLYKNEDYKENIQDYKESRAEYIAECKEAGTCNTLSDLKECLQEFQDLFEWDDEKYCRQTGRPTLFIEYTGEDYVSSLEGYFDDDKEAITDDYFCSESCCEYYEYHDGSNWKKIYLTGPAAWDIEEIEDKELIQSFEDADFVFDDKPDTNYTHYNNFYFDKKYGNMWIEQLSLYQGHLTDYVLIEDEEEIAKYFVMFLNEEEIEILRPDIIKEYGHNLRILEYNGEYFQGTIWEIFSKDDAELIGSWVNDPYRRTHGHDYYKLGDRIIVFSWTAFQGDRSSWSVSEKTEDEAIEFCK